MTIGIDNHEEYLGDAVYASFDGFHVWLRAGHNRIALEPEVIRALIDYEKRICAHFGVPSRVSGTDRNKSSSS